uniref:Mediator of RNA polymerase II transcription subunit 28 n=27 Tax=Neognathae TaxID=8825 RepID=A0A8C3QUT7_9PASS
MTKSNGPALSHTRRFPEGPALSGRGRSWPAPLPPHARPPLRHGGRAGRDVRLPGAGAAAAGAARPARPHSASRGTAQPQQHAGGRAGSVLRGEGGQPRAGAALPAPAPRSRSARGFSLPQACFASLVSQDYVNGTDQEEIRTGVDQCIQKFLDVARQTECFFLQKRLQLSVQKPEQVIKEDVSELRNELQRKEALIQKHLSKLRHWQQVLEDISVQHKKPAEMPQGPLAYLEQASANIPAPMKQT